MFRHVRLKLKRTSHNKKFISSKAFRQKVSLSGYNTILYCIVLLYSLMTTHDFFVVICFFNFNETGGYEEKGKQTNLPFILLSRR